MHNIAPSQITAGKPKFVSDFEKFPISGQVEVSLFSSRTVLLCKAQALYFFLVILIRISFATNLSDAIFTRRKYYSITDTS